jgi:hypothetical protein
MMPFSIQKPSQNTPKINFFQLTIQELIFSVSNTEFEGGGDGDGHGHGEGTFLVKQAQPSHTMPQCHACVAIQYHTRPAQFHLHASANMQLALVQAIVAH